MAEIEVRMVVTDDGTYWWHVSFGHAAHRLTDLHPIAFSWRPGDKFGRRLETPVRP